MGAAVLAHGAHGAGPPRGRAAEGPGALGLGDLGQRRTVRNAFCPASLCR